MKPVYSVLGLLLLLSLQAVAGDVHGRTLITNSGSKKGAAPIVYRLPNTAERARTPEPENDFDDIAVILEPDEGTGIDTAKFAPRPVTATMKQEGGRIRPEMLIVPIGSIVEFLNFNPIFGDAKAEWSDAKSLAGESHSVRLDSPGVVQIHCHTAGNNDSVIVVTASPWYQKPLADGTFSFSDVPGGHYSLIVWRKSSGPYRTSVVVPESGNVDATISVPIDSDR